MYLPRQSGLGDVQHLPVAAHHLVRQAGPAPAGQVAAGEPQPVPPGAAQVGVILAPPPGQLADGGVAVHYFRPQRRDLLGQALHEAHVRRAELCPRHEGSVPDTGRAVHGFSSPVGSSGDQDGPEAGDAEATRGARRLPGEPRVRHGAVHPGRPGRAAGGLGLDGPHRRAGHRGRPGRLHRRRAGRRPAVGVRARAGDGAGPGLPRRAGPDVPSAHGAWLAARCPDAELWLRPDDGHVSVLGSCGARPWTGW